MAEIVTKRHPVRAAFWGLLIGLGLVIWFTFAQPVIGLDNIVNVLIRWGIVIVAAIIIAIVVALILPPKKPKGPPPDEAPSASEAAADPAAGGDGDGSDGAQSEAER